MGLNLVIKRKIEAFKRERKKYEGEEEQIILTLEEREGRGMGSRTRLAPLKSKFRSGVSYSTVRDMFE